MNVVSSTLRKPSCSRMSRWTPKLLTAWTSPETQEVDAVLGAADEAHFGVLGVDVGRERLQGAEVAAGVVADADLDVAQVVRGADGAVVGDVDAGLGDGVGVAPHHAVAG